MGYYPILVDPLTHPQKGPFKAVVLLAHSSDITYKYMGKLHTQELYCFLQEGSVIVDPWRTYPKDTNKYKVVHYGNTRDV